MRIRITKPVVIKGHPGVDVGHVLEVSDAEGQHLIRELVAEAFKQDEAVTIETREPEVENRDIPQTPEKQPRKSSKRNPAS